MPRHEPGALATPRRAFIGTLSVGLLAARRRVHAQAPARVPRVGWLSGAAGVRPDSPQVTAFTEGLRESGYVLGRNVLLEIRTPGDTVEQYPHLAAGLVAAGVDVILAANPHSLEAVTQATKTIPVVGVDLESDPVARGWVASLARPGGNVTGFFLDIPEMSGKQLQFLKEVKPTLTRVAVIGDPRVNDLQFRAIETAARPAGFTLQPLPVTSPNEIPATIAEAAHQRAGALAVLTSPLVNNNLRPIADASVKHRLPAICSFVPGFAEAGGLLAYGPGFLDLFRRAGAYAGAILKGATPGRLPVQRPTKFELVINTKTAKALGLRIPQSFLLRADQVIE
jgi:putative ABC transport system substrate-binding protein